MTKRKDRAGPGKVGRKENDRTESDVYGRSRKKRVEKKGCSRKERLGLGGATKISDTGVSQNGKKREKKRKKRKKNRAREKVGWRREKEREQKKNPKYLYPVCYKAPRGTKRGGFLWRGRSNGGRFRQLSH